MTSYIKGADMRAKAIPTNQWITGTYGLLYTSVSAFRLGVLNIAVEVLNVDLAVGQRTKKATKGRLRSRLNWHFNVADSYDGKLRF